MNGQRRRLRGRVARRILRACCSTLPVTGGSPNHEGVASPREPSWAALAPHKRTQVLSDLLKLVTRAVCFGFCVPLWTRFTFDLGLKSAHPRIERETLAVEHPTRSQTRCRFAPWSPTA